MHKSLPNFFIFADQYSSSIFKNKNTSIGIIYRNYKDGKREKQLVEIAKNCKKHRYKLFVSNDLRLAQKYKADGIYIPSFNKTSHFSNLEKKNIIIIGSAHNQKEIHTKIAQNCSAIFLSPLFFVKKSKNFLGLHKFNYLSRLNKKKIFALGGISEKNIKKIKLLSIKGLGGISLFKKKPAYKRPVFIKNKFF